MIIILSIAVMAIFLFFMKSEQEREANKATHEKEVIKLNLLRENPELNERYSKCMSICERIVLDFSNAKTKDEKHFRFHIPKDSPYSGSHNIYAKGWISSDEFLTTSWVLNDPIKVNVSYRNSSKGESEKYFELRFNRIDSEALILKKIYDSIGKIK